jgi:LmbE family N-acetylglucosaminyl deacetylase
MKYTVADIAKAGTILGVWAHPDDECWTSAGVIATAAANGQRVVCITATRGDAGQTADPQKWPIEQLGEIRQHELNEALAILGESEHYWLNYKDGMLARTNPEAPVNQIAAIMQEVKPDVVITFGPDGLTGHLDHKTISVWTQEAMRQSRCPAELWMAVEQTEKYQTTGKALHEFANIYCDTVQPFTVPAAEADVYFVLADDILQKKIAALKAHASQMQHIFADKEAGAALCAHAQGECFMKAVDR